MSYNSEVIFADFFSRLDFTENFCFSVERMGGIYSNAFHDGVTHLVAKMVKSRKYEVAIQKEVPVMTEEWIDLVWDKSRNKMCHATDSEFSRYLYEYFLEISV